MRATSNPKFVFVLPGILWVLFFTVFPLLYSLRLAFMNARMGSPQTFVGFDNFRRAFTDYRVWNSAAVTLLFAVFSVVLTVSIGLGLAILFHREMHGQHFFRS